LHGYADSPLAGSFLTLRENEKFERTSSGMLMSFDAGTWSLNQDTITLTYVDLQQKPILTQNLYIDRKNSTLIFQGEENAPAYIRLRNMYNGLVK
jgi:hypothetical protein